MTDPAPRIELKFCGLEVDSVAVDRWIRNHSMEFTEVFEERVVNNIYFDSHALSCYHDNVAGQSAREKLRYRWYTHTLHCRTFEPGQLEIKVRKNSFGTKTSQPVDRAPCATLPWPSIIRTIHQQVTGELRQLLDRLVVPVLINRYTRRYYLSKDRRLRITVDRNLGVWDQRYRRRPNFSRRALLLPRGIVVEAKFGRNVLPGLSNEFLDAPLRITRHSKYVNGVRAITNY